MSLKTFSVNLISQPWYSCEILLCSTLPIPWINSPQKKLHHRVKNLTVDTINVSSDLRKLKIKLNTNYAKALRKLFRFRKSSSLSL